MMFVSRCSRIFPFALLGLLLSMFSLLFASGTAFASATHAEYVSSTPAANAMLKSAPTTIAIHFSENVDPNGSDISVYDVNGKLVSTGVAQVDRSDLKTMNVTLKSDQSEVYVVMWHNVSAVEGHHDSGSFRFFVNISAMLQGMINGGKMSGMPGSSSGTSSQSSSSSDGIPVWSAALIGIVGLIVGALSAFVVRGPRRATVTKA